MINLVSVLKTIVNIVVAATTIVVALVSFTLKDTDILPLLLVDIPVAILFFAYVFSDSMLRAAETALAIASNDIDHVYQVRVGRFVNGEFSVSGIQQPERTIYRTFAEARTEATSFAAKNYPNRQDIIAQVLPHQFSITESKIVEEPSNDNL